MASHIPSNLPFYQLDDPNKPKDFKGHYVYDLSNGAPTVGALTEFVKACRPAGGDEKNGFDKDFIQSVTANLAAASKGLQIALKEQGQHMPPEISAQIKDVLGLLDGLQKGKGSKAAWLTWGPSGHYDDTNTEKTNGNVLSPLLPLVKGEDVVRDNEDKNENKTETVVNLDEASTSDTKGLDDAGDLPNASTFPHIPLTDERLKVIQEIGRYYKPRS